MGMIKFIPGDLIEFEEESVLITSILNSPDGIEVQYFHAESDKPIFEGRPYPYAPGYIDAYSTSNLYYDTAFQQNFMPPKKISHLFDFNIYNSEVCRESICFPRQITGECSGCPLGSLSPASKISNLYLPGDQVYMVMEKKLGEITEVCLTIRSDMTDSRGGGFSNFKSDISTGNWYLSLFAKMFATNYYLDYMTLPEAWNILKQKFYCKVQPRFYIKGEKSGRWSEQIRLRKRGHCTYLKEEDLNTICGMCIYQRGMEPCLSCNIENRRTQLYG